MNQFEEQEYTKSFDMKIWLKIFVYAKKHKKYLITLMTCMFFIALGESAFPLATKYAIDNIIVAEDVSTMPVFMGIYMSLVVAMGLFVLVFINCAGKLEAGIVYDIRKDGFTKLQSLSFSYYDNTAVGWIMARLTSDASRISEVVAWGCVDLVWGFSLVFILIFNMFILNAQLALIALSVMPVLLVVSYFFQKNIFKSHRQVRKINSKITGSFNEGITGARTTKTLTREERNYEEFQELTMSMKRSSIHAAVLSAIFLPVVISLGSIATGLVLWKGGTEVLADAISIGMLAVFLTYATQMFEPIQQIVRVFSDIQSAQASAERTLSLIEADAAIVDNPEVVAVFGDEKNPKKENWPFIKGHITFSHVDFAYATGEKILEDFTLDVKEGEKIALVGETGSGKSTIVNLICRFYEPTGGEVLIDGVDYRKRSQLWLQSNLGYVLQTPNLFSGSVMENIRYGKLEASDDEVINAARMVNAYDFIMKMDGGFGAEVGEGGSKLSAGERQLISFARAIIGDPRIFILDEATSSIDTETEQIIQKAVDNVLKGRTSFIVAHRLSTIRSCDRILVIQNGKVIEEGNHTQLLKAKGHYYNLYTNQFKQEAESRLLS